MEKTKKRYISGCQLEERHRCENRDDLSAFVYLFILSSESSKIFSDIKLVSIKNVTPLTF
jgi:hypothetical protein